MRYIYLICFLVCSAIAQSQPVGQPTALPTTYGGKIYQFKQYLQADSGFFIPIRDTNFYPKQRGAMVFRPTDKKPYYFDSSKWVVFGSAPVPTLQQVVASGGTTTSPIATGGLTFPFYNTINTESPAVWFQSFSSDFYRTFTAINGNLDQTEKVEESGDNCSSWSTGTGQRWRWAYTGIGTPKSPFIIDYDTVHVDGQFEVKNGGIVFNDGTTLITSPNEGAFATASDGTATFYPIATNIKFVDIPSASVNTGLLLNATKQGQTINIRNGKGTSMVISPSYINLSNSTVNTIAANSALLLVFDGTDYKQF